MASFLFTLLQIAAQPATPGPTVPIIPPAERAAIFKAAGAKQFHGVWKICAEDPQATGATIDEVRDINGDGRPDAIVSESGSFCYGMAGTGFKIVSKQADGRWTLVAGSAGIPQFLPTRGIEGWPDLSVGGPGTCFPIQFWNKRSYVTYRYAYEGKPCRP